MPEIFGKKISLIRGFLWGAATLLLIILVMAAAVFFSLPDVEYLKNRNPESSALIEQRRIEARDAGRKLNVHQQWVRFSAIPDLLKKAVRISEDASFYQHEGFDYVEFKESVKRNWEEGRLARGGSTITQQLAKNLYLSTDKSFLRKIKEYFIARRLENTLSKNRIFHLYLNIIEFGPGVFGVQAASRYYFKKDVSRLNLEEMVRLAAIIPRPLITPASSDSGWLKWKCRWILGKLKLYKYISEEQYQGVIDRFKR